MACKHFSLYSTVKLPYTRDYCRLSIRVLELSMLLGRR